MEARESEKVLCDIHDGPVEGHFSGNTTVQKFMWASLYWLTLFKYSHAYASKCMVYQKCAGRGKKLVAPLQPIAMEEPFQQWGLDVIGDIFLHSSKQRRYILTTTYYFMWWAEVVPLKQVNYYEVINFLKENTISRFGVSNSLVFDNATYF